MKVLFLAAWYPNRYDSMFGLFVKRHAEALSLQHRVDVVYVVKSDTQKKNFTVDIQQSGNLREIGVYYRPILSGLAVGASFFSLMFYFWAARKGIACSISEGRPDITHVHVLTRMGVVAMLYKWLSGCPYVITEHWSRYQDVTGNFKGLMRKWATRLVVRQAGALTTVTQHLLKAMEKHKLKAKETHILPNVVAEPFFNVSLPVKANRSQPFQIVHVSCFEDRSKNLSGLLRAIKRLRELRNDFRLVMIGDGMDFAIIREYAKKLGLTDEIVHFTGLKTAEEIAEVFSQSRFLLMFSHYENLPVVINEAFACGLPVVSSRVGGIAELVGNEEGILVASGDEEGLTVAMNEMLSRDFQPAQAYQLREKMQKLCSPQALCREIEDIYNKVLDV